MSRDNKLVNLFAVITFFAAIIPNFMTVQPTIPFWDCGEFIACSISMGIPHPPGTPLFIIIGRVISMLFSSISEIAFRINLISVLSNAVTIVILYFTLIRFLRMVFQKEEGETLAYRLITPICSFVGALLVSYSYTWWFNTVEAEVYSISSLIIALEVWLALKWYDVRKSPGADRFLILLMYLAFLGIGAAQTTVLLLPFVFLFVVLNDPEKMKSWQLWLVGFCALSVMFSIASFLIVGPVMTIACLLWVLLKRDTAKIVCLIFLGAFGIWQLKSSLPNKTEELDGMGILLGLAYLAIAILPYVIKPESIEKEASKWRFAFFIVFFAFIGYSVHLVIPVRSWTDPIVDENNPEVKIEKVSDLFEKESWDKLIYFLERKQYGSESMIARMFYRRGQLYNQFINHQHMGFGGYLATQFFNFGDQKVGEIILGDNKAFAFLKLLIYLLPIFFVTWGVWYMYKHNRNHAIFMGLGLLACTIGLVMFMNFADGTVPEKRDLIQWEQSGRMGQQPQPIQMEVRERDYFWTPGFMFYAMWVGLAFASLLHFLLTKYGDRVRKYLPVLLLLIAATPVIPLTQNFTSRTRAGNWVAFDYGYNLLMSCDRDAVLFTNGDNDTFPLWALQEAYGIRKDVRIVNLSLLNTDWYIEQLFDNKPKLNVPTVLFDEGFRPRLVSKQDFVKYINHQRNGLQQPMKAQISKWKLEVEIPPAQKTSFFRIQDYMIINIVHGEAGNRPINFAVTVSDNNYMGLAPYLLMDGLVYRLMPQVQNQRLDMPATLHKLDNIYRFTNLGSKDLHLNEETERLLSNYAACFFGYVYEERAVLQGLRDREKVLVKEIADLGAAGKSDPSLLSAKNSELTDLKAKIDVSFSNMKRQLDRCVSILPKDWRGRMLSAQMFAGDNRFELAEKVLTDGVKLTPEEYMIQVNLGFLYRDMNKSKEAVSILEKVVYEMDSDFKQMKHRETVGAISALLEMYRANGSKDKLKALLQKWVEANPGDQQSQQELMRL
ncbi:MAG: DUF2723 domain-containing protein [Fibrobacteres bacterium]|nr:DUF2723 domain-containing protein [Fibrobacterota bacterium]